MNILNKTALCIALSAASVLGAGTSATAQGGPVGSGSGSFVAQNGEVHQFAFSVNVLPGGAVQGALQVVEPGSGAIVRVQLSSLMFVGDSLAMAGTITTAVNAPPWFVVGETAFFVVNDNDGTGTPDEFAGVGVVPPGFGSLTIQEIVGLIGPPPPQAFSPLINGDIRID